MPIKRNEFLKAIGRDHHYSLLLCWKIKTGLRKQIEPERIIKYVDWFYTSHLLPHFEIEENYIFPILGTDNEIIKKALTEHNSLQILCLSLNEIPNNLTLIAQELDHHIRFEERILFAEIEKNATIEQLQDIYSQQPESKFIDNFNDPFWEE